VRRFSTIDKKLAADKPSDLSSPVIMQDPRFTELDKVFLKSMGCAVVDDPEAFLHVNQNSFVYAIHCPFFILWKVKETSYPALLIGNNLRNFFQAQKPSSYGPGQSGNELEPYEESRQGIGESGPIHSVHYEQTICLIQDCDETAFPQLRHDFSDTIIYWRRSGRRENAQDAVAMENP
jgi:hypothetical protein